MQEQVILNERLYINASGNVGIGTSSPSAITNYTITQIEGTTSGLLAFSSAGTVQGRLYGGSTLLAIEAMGSRDIVNYTNSTERMRITSGGNVVINTSGTSALNAGQLVNKQRSDTTTPYLNGIVNMANGSSKNLTIFYDGNNNVHNISATYYTGGDGGAFSPLAFQTSDTERMRITSDGNLLLGTTDNGSGAKLVFFSTTAAQQLKAAGTAPAITFSNTITSPTIGGSLGACTSAGQFLSGTAAGDLILINQFTGNKLYITNYSGGVYLTQGATSWTANSDIRLKNINSHIENAVEKLSTLQTINFSYKDDKFNKQNLGLIAQEVEKIFPELIDKNGDGMLGVRYTELVPVLIKAVQELKAEIETLKNK